LIRTFNALLMISRVEAGSAAAEMSVVNLSEVAEEFGELYEPVAEDAGFILRRDVAPGVVVRGNRELIGQAISNLIDNAMKYGDNPDAPEITLSVASSADGVRVTVADRGQGVPEDKYGDVVKRFFRLDESRSKPGTGLGLALTVAVMELHGGRVELSPTEAGKEHPGLSVTMVFPVG
jgi:signal transduction histidine kinase